MENKYKEEIKKLKEKVSLLETIIDQLRNLELYENTVDYDWDERPYEVSLPFDLDEFIDDIKYMKQNQKTK